MTRKMKDIGVLQLLKEDRRGDCPADQEARMGQNSSYVLGLVGGTRKGQQRFVLARREIWVDNHQGQLNF